MNKKVIASVFGVLVLGAIIGVFLMKKSASAPSNTSNMPTNMDMTKQNAQAQVTDKVTIKDYAFSPATITVKKGTKVTWTNQDSVGHTISPDTETADFKASSIVNQGDSYSVTFNTVGTFTYHCDPHPYMKATVVVTE